MGIGRKCEEYKKKEEGFILRYKISNFDLHSWPKRMSELTVYSYFFPFLLFYNNHS